MLILGMLIFAAVIYSRLFRKQEIIKTLETITVFVLVGYCGVFIFAICVYGIYDPIKMANFVRFPAGHPFQMFLTFSLLGMSIISILSIWLRGAYLIAPVVSWSVFWFGATYVHLHDVYSSKGYISLKYFLIIFASHGLVSVLLLGLMGVRYHLSRKVQQAYT